MGGTTQGQGKYVHLTLQRPVRTGEAFPYLIPQLY